MPKFNFLKSCSVRPTGRVKQLQGMFDLQESSVSEFQLSGDLPIEEKEWNVGLIIGPSGSGKTSLVNEVFKDVPHIRAEELSWDNSKSVVDEFPVKMSIKEITMLLSSVGFSSPPNWLRPFSVLSNGEQFRLSIARLLAENAPVTIVDEFTSVIDRQVAQYGCAAIAKTIRKRNQKFIGVSCHFDIVDWIQPDWVFEVGVNQFQWRYLQRRPSVTFNVQRVDKAAWQLFKKHHYLSHEINKTAKCFLATISQRPVAFTSVISFVHPKRPGWRLHRTVVLPDFQGIGIGNKLTEFVASCMVATGKPVFSTTSHPAMMRYRAKSILWSMRKHPRPTHGGRSANVNRKGMNKTAASQRLVAGFEYVGRANYIEARKFELI